MKKIVVLLGVFFIHTALFSTAQFPDKITYKNTQYKLLTNPLEPFFNEFPEKHPETEIISTALWRGYVASFEIINNELFVVDIEIQYKPEAPDNDHDLQWKSVMDEVFPEQKRVKADWFSGILVLPFGDLIKYKHMSYASVYKNYILLEINNGSLVKERRLNHKKYEKFKQKQYEAFQKTKEYQEMKKVLIDEGSTEEFAETFLKDLLIEYTRRPRED